MTDEQIAENFSNIRSQIKEAEIRSNRNEGSVKLCAVSKFHPISSIVSAMKANQFLFGENRVQEAYDKFTELNNNSLYIQKPELHIIGSLQSNKVKHAVEISSCIQSVDREGLLVEIEKQCAKINKTISILFELHTGEESKSGYVSLDDLRHSIEHCANNNYPHIVVKGLMTMAPFTEDEKEIRASFSKLRNVAGDLSKEFPTLSFTELSMGMSNDFKIAIEEGSTMVRIGTALFGPREIIPKEVQ